jgi:hypothetical protein
MQRQGDQSHVTSGRNIEPSSDSVLLMDHIQAMSIRESRAIYRRVDRLMIFYI